MESFFYRYSFHFHMSVNLVRKVRLVLDSCSVMYRRGYHTVRLQLQYCGMPAVSLGRYSVGSTGNLCHQFHCGGTIKVLQYRINSTRIDNASRIFFMCFVTVNSVFDRDCCE